MSSFIKPMEDFCAKELFENEKVRIYFISDILDIPLESIKSTKIINPFLRKVIKTGKQGIVDVKIELNNNTKINIEIQIEHYAFWDKRSMFYLAKIFIEDLMRGKDYCKLKKCIGISILDFNYRKDEEYHSVYKFRDNSGKVFTDLFELHIIELKKVINGNRKVDEWIRFFNIENEEDMGMLKTGNLGIKAAIEELTNMNLSDRMRAQHEAKLKQKRDQRAREQYVIEQGRAQGMEQGRVQGMEQGRAQGIEQGRVQGMEQGRAQGMEQGRVQGIVQGIEQGKIEAARNLIGVLPLETIAEKIGISLDIVQQLENGEK